MGMKLIVLVLWFGFGVQRVRDRLEFCLVFQKRSKLISGYEWNESRVTTANWTEVAYLVVRFGRYSSFNTDDNVLLSLFFLSDSYLYQQVWSIKRDSCLQLVSDSNGRAHPLYSTSHATSAAHFFSICDETDEEVVKYHKARQNLLHTTRARL